MKKFIFGVALTSALIAGSAFAGGDVEAGKATSKKCMACHGADGVSKMDMYPNLAGQKQKYLVSQMKAFRDGKRVNPMMKGPSAGLSDADINNLAAFYSSQGK